MFPVCRPGLALLLLLAAPSLLGAAEPADARLKPGATFHLDFPDLPVTWNNKKPARLGIFLPEDYKPERTYPLVVWFGGGPGGDNPGPAVSIVGRQGWVCAALPYNNNGGWETDWSYYQTMLRELDKVVPNINPKQRVCSGFSSGGAAITHGMGNSKGFRDYFYAFMPGGAGWAMGSLAGLKGRPMLAFMGDKDTRLSGYVSLVEAAKTAGMDVTFLKYDAGHEMPAAHYGEMRDWLREKVVQRELPQLTTLMNAEFAAKRFSKAYQAAREVSLITQPTAPEHVRALDVMAKARPFGEAEAKKMLAGATPMAAKQQFVREWHGCDFTQEVEAQCLAVAESQLAKILAQQPVSPVYLKKFIDLWNGFSVNRRAIESFDQLAAGELTKVTAIESPDARNRALQTFATTWSPTESAAKAAKLRESLAAEELAKIKAIKAKGTMKAKLTEFIRNYAGTAAEQEARELQRKRD